MGYAWTGGGPADFDSGGGSDGSDSGASDPVYGVGPGDTTDNTPDVRDDLVDDVLDSGGSSGSDPSLDGDRTGGPGDTAPDPGGSDPASGDTPTSDYGDDDGSDSSPSPDPDPTGDNNNSNQTPPDGPTNTDGIDRESVLDYIDEIANNGDSGPGPGGSDPPAPDVGGPDGAAPDPEIFGFSLPTVGGITAGAVAVIVVIGVAIAGGDDA